VTRYLDLCKEVYEAIVCIGQSRGHPDRSPSGTSILSITTLFRPKAWHGLSQGEYIKTKNRIAGELIAQFEQATGTSLREHIEEIEVATPLTYARYTGGRGGTIYGYEPEPWDSLMPGLMTFRSEVHFDGLELCCGYAFRCHGYSSSQVRTDHRTPGAEGSDRQGGDTTMKANVRGNLLDPIAFRRLVPKRKKRIAKARPQLVGLDPVNLLARDLHPDVQHLVITEVWDETPTARSFRLVPQPGSVCKNPAYFRAGQYLSLKLEVNGVEVTRPYSIASAPHETLGAGKFYQITMKRSPDGFVVPYVWDNWHVGTTVRASGPLGTFYHDLLRGPRQNVGLAGGSGITPFHSMAREIAFGDLDAEVLLLYGSSDQGDIVFFDELRELEAQVPGKIRVVHVLSCEQVTLEGCEQGFITADTIGKYADLDKSTFFLCGPQAMVEFVEKELATLGLPRRRTRREVYGTPKDITRAPGFPVGPAGETFRLTVHIGDTTTQVPARATETVLVAMERANLTPPSQCRSGECGFCRSLLLSGDVYFHPDGADRQYGVIHPCSSYPLADLELEATRGGWRHQPGLGQLTEPCRVVLPEGVRVRAGAAARRPQGLAPHPERCVDRRSQ
jgi:ferredoxin-NADP reductase